MKIVIFQEFQNFATSHYHSSKRYLSYSEKKLYNWIKTSARIGAWEVKLEIMRDHLTDRSTNRLKDGHEAVQLAGCECS